MFFRKKKKTEVAERDVAKAAPLAADPEPQADSADGAAGGPAASQSPNGKATGTNRSLHLALGKITSLMAGSPVFQQAKLSDLLWLVLPAIRSKQVAIAEVRDAAGNSGPVAAVLWARVSEQVDRRLSDNPTFPPQLKAEDWTSGNIPWVVLVVGAETACGATIAQICKTVFDGRTMKTSIRDAKGKATVKELTVAA